MPVRTVREQGVGEAEDALRSRAPGYADTVFFDELRAREYHRLDATGSVYLDYTGGGLYAESQLREHLALLQSRVFGNPHSTNPTSGAMTELVEATRRSVLRYFRADPDEYVAIFTPNCSGALRVVGESYPFSATRPYALTWDNHNSVNGVREFARAKGAPVRYLPFATPELRIDIEQVRDGLRNVPPGLFAFPAQSNFSGVQHPLELVAEAKDLGWDVLLDCAAFVPTNRLDLSVIKPDLVPLSFYKIFGYPTGVGALIVRREVLARLRRPWFAGGTISIVSVQGEGWHYLEDGVAAFEDGTVNYLSLPAVDLGLRHIESIGIERIHHRLPAAGRPRTLLRLSAVGDGRRRRRHLAAHRLLLQSGVGRARQLPRRRHDGPLLRSPRTRHLSTDVREGTRVRQGFQCAADLPRHRHQLRRRVALHAVGRNLP